MAYVRWNPFHELEEVIDRYHRSLTLPQGDNATGNGSREALTRADWSPAVDISESADAYRISVELPAVPKEDVKVSVHNGLLSISGERRLEKEAADFKHRRIERVYGRFNRSFTLPEDVDENAIRAEYKDGVLTLNIPKAAKPQPKAIEVQVH